jgi:hypothetical protein
MAEKITTKRARVFLELFASAKLRDVGTVDAASYSFEEQTIEKESTNEVRGIIKSETIKTDGTLTLTMGSTEWDNFVTLTRSKESVQAAVASGTFTFPVGEAGKSFKLPSANVLSITATGLVEGVDYQLFKASGIVGYLRDVTAAVADCTYSAGVAKRAGITAAGERMYTVHVTDELNGEYTCLFKWKPNLPTSVELVKPNEFGTYEVSGKLMLDTTKPVNGDLGQFGVKYEAQVDAE